MIRDAVGATFMAKPKPITQDQYEALASFRYALRKFLRFSEQAAQSAGITPQQHQALLVIKGFSTGRKVTVGEMAERLQVAHHSAVGLIDRMTVEKWVKREPSKTDKRQVFISLTKRGERVLEELSALHHEELRRVGPEMQGLLSRLGNEE
jgi:DNA-binding MarR family transcriptional regulator